MKIKQFSDGTPVNTDNKELLETYKVGDSALIIIGNEDRGYSLTLGKQRLLPWFKTIQELEDYIGTEFLHVQMLITGVMLEQWEAFKETPEYKNKTYSLGNEIENMGKISADHTQNSPEQ